MLVAKYFTMTEWHKKSDILIGVLLGDASLQTYTHGKTWRLRFIQSEIHKDYLFHLHDCFQFIVKTPPRKSVDSSGYKRWYFNTVVNPELNHFAELFYTSKNRKKVPSNIQDYFTDRSLAYWFMDDGSLKSNTSAYIFCTDSFSLDELKILKELFITKYNVYPSFHKQRKGQYRLYIPRKYFETLKEIMEPHIHESFKYKLQHSLSNK